MAVTDHSFWAGRRVLVTGHTGFKGAWLSLWLEHMDAEVSGLGLSPESSEGTFGALGSWSRLDSHFVDIRDARAVENVIRSTAPEVVFHLAAQALVRQGWADPETTYAVNVVGTSNLLEAVSSIGCARAVVVVTSDKVYANAGRDEAFREDSPLGGRDPYSASKAAAEFVVDAWRTANPKVPVATVRAGNVIGGGDVAEDRLLPDAWRALRAERALMLRNPAAIRPWQFVLDPLAGYMQVGQTLINEPETCPPSLNFGPAPSQCRDVVYLAESVFAEWGSGRWLDGHEPGARAEAAVLTLDAGLARRSIGWRPRLGLDMAVQWTVEWWRAADAGVPLRPLATAQLEAYERLPAL